MKKLYSVYYQWLNKLSHPDSILNILQSKHILCDIMLPKAVLVSALQTSAEACHCNGFWSCFQTQGTWVNTQCKTGPDHIPIKGQKAVTLERAIIQEKTHFIKPAYMVTNFPSQNTPILRAGNCLVKNCYVEKAPQGSLWSSSTEPHASSSGL